MERGKRKVKVGTVKSDKMEGTLSVAVESYYQHPLYKKTLRKVKKFKVDDRKNKGKLGDVVKIIETRPISKTKRWQLVEIIKKAE